MRTLVSIALLALLAANAACAADGFHATMDRTFGKGGWRETSGYRTPAQEAALRRAGAGTVAPGRRSAHSLGRPGAPGAYDVVVPGMSQAEAAARLRRGGRLGRVVAEKAHGGQGPHLHIELAASRGRFGARDEGVCAAYAGERIYARVVNGARNPLILCEERWRARAAARR